jgi:hypothetical protein
MDWLGEQELCRMLEERIQRYKARCRAETDLERIKWDNRASWYTLGFRDAWGIANSLRQTIETRKEEEQMAKKSDELTQGDSAPPERAGKPGKSPLHEGPAGSGPIAKSKFSKETRDNVSEKEPQKSRGPVG